MTSVDRINNTDDDENDVDDDVTTTVPRVVATRGGSGIHQSQCSELGRYTRESVSFSGKRNVSKTHNINSIRLFRVRKAQRRHCANASAVTSRELPNKWPHFLAKTKRGWPGITAAEKRAHDK